MRYFSSFQAISNAKLGFKQDFQWLYKQMITSVFSSSAEIILICPDDKEVSNRFTKPKNKYEQKSSRKLAWWK